MELSSDLKEYCNLLRLPGNIKAFVSTALMGEVHLFSGCYFFMMLHRVYTYIWVNSHVPLWRL